MRLAERLATALWVQLPSAVGRRFRPVGIVLADGSYLLRWTPVALGLPVVAFVAGLAVGAWRPREDLLYTYSILYPAVLLGLASFGAAIGLWAWLGFVIGDFLLFPHVFYRLDPIDHAIREQFPLLITYELLFALLVLGPLAVRGMADGAIRPVHRLVPAGAPRAAVRLLAAAIVAGLVAAAWSSSTQILIRPVATLQDTILDPRAVQTFRMDGSALILVAVVGGVVGLVLGRRTPVLPAAGPPARSQSTRSVVAGSVVVGVLVGIGLLGLLDQPADAVFLFGATILAALIRSAIPRWLPAYASAVNRIPLIIRVIAIAVLGDLTGTAILQATSLDGSLLESFRPLLLSATVAMLLAALAFPAAQPAMPQAVAA